MKLISTKLKLAYSPLSARELAWAKDDEDIKKALSKAHLYMIAKKPQIYFRNVKLENSVVSLDIVNTKGCANISIPTSQPIFAIESDKELFVQVGSNEKEITMNGDTCETAHGLKFYKIEREKCNDSLRQNMTAENFVLWLSPEKLLFQYRNKQLKISNFDKSKNFFWDYEVMYIGKATEQSVCKRLDGHKTLLQILEEEIEYYEQIRDDVVLLFFEVLDSENANLVDENMSEEEFIQSIDGTNQPSIKTLLLEAEKIFVSEFKPKYNKKIFVRYPKGDDGLYSYNYNLIDYTIYDDINLVFKNCVFRGGYGGNHLVYSKDCGLVVKEEKDFQKYIAEKMASWLIDKNDDEHNSCKESI